MTERDVVGDDVQLDAEYAVALCNHCGGGLLYGVLTPEVEALFVRMGQEPLLGPEPHALRLGPMARFWSVAPCTCRPVFDFMGHMHARLTSAEG